MNTLTPGLRRFPPKLKRAIDVLCAYHADMAQGEMRTNARWTDQTGNARNGLMARAVSRSDESAIVLFHSVPYGIWLEVRWSGRYAIIKPTIVKTGRSVMRDCRKLMRRIPGG